MCIYSSINENENVIKTSFQDAFLTNAILMEIGGIFFDFL